MNIFDHTSLNSFLQAYYADIKAKRPAFSYTSWAKMMGIKNSASLFKVLSGERRPGKKLALQMEVYFSFSTHEREYFRLLTVLDRSPLNTEFCQALLQTARVKLSQKSQKKPV